MIKFGLFVVLKFRDRKLTIIWVSLNNAVIAYWNYNVICKSICKSIIGMQQMVGLPDFR